MVNLKNILLFATILKYQIPKKKRYYLEQRLEFDSRQGFSVSDLKITNNNKYFYLKKSSNEKAAKLYYRDGFLGKEEFLFDPASFKSSDGDHEYIINYISPSLVGDKIAIAMAEKGRELADVIIMELKGRHIRPEIINNIMLQM